MYIYGGGVVKKNASISNETVSIDSSSLPDQTLDYTDYARTIVAANRYTNQ